MPLYYFHTRNGRLSLDERGEAFDDRQKACNEALSVMGEILRDRSVDFWESRAFSVVVTDQQRRPVVTLTAVASDDFPDDWETATAWTSKS